MENQTPDNRYATLEIAVQLEVFSFDICQTQLNLIVSNENEYSIDARRGTVEIPYRSNVKTELTISEEGKS